VRIVCDGTASWSVAGYGIGGCIRFMMTGQVILVEGEKEIHKREILRKERDEAFHILLFQTN
jgi:hypothetical protein